MSQCRLSVVVDDDYSWLVGLLWHALHRRHTIAYYTNQYKDVIAQREFSASEARSLIAPALKTFPPSLLFATSEEHSRTRFKLVNTALDALKLAFQACFLPAYFSVELVAKKHAE